uniref:WD repeat domain 7 n=1 Tax=Pipistrellus kuhlii TaxID=59472 RepID=A0A7J7YBH2_PIPKU|nr:WD repeat domain 7 [Pipistrellus kuhlii]
MDDLFVAAKMGASLLYLPRRQPSSSCCKGNTCSEEVGHLTEHSVVIGTKSHVCYILIRSPLVMIRDIWYLEVWIFRS